MQREPAPARGLLSIISFLWLNLFFWTIAPLVTVIFVTGGAIYASLFLLFTRSIRRTQWVIRRSISHYGATILKLGWPLVTVRYVDHAPDAKPPFVFVCNHRSASDAFLMACLPFECIQVLNNWPGRIPIFNLIGHLAEYLRVREIPFDEFVRRGSKLLGEGVSIITFPEGTRSGSRRLGPFHGSAFRLAQHAGAPIVPLAISGNENIPPRGSMLLRPGKIVVSKLPAVTSEQFKEMSGYKLKTLVRERIRQHLDAQPA